MDAKPIDIRRSAMDLLARREHTSLELVNKLSRRYADRGLIEEQVRQLSLENLQSNQRYAESFVRTRIRKGQGPVRIINELAQKGVPEHQALQVFEEQAVDWFAVIDDVYKSKYGDTQPQSDKEKAKMIRFFQYRGFEFEQIRQVF